MAKTHDSSTEIHPAGVEYVVTWAEYHHAPGRYQVTVVGRQGGARGPTATMERTLGAGLWWADAERMVNEGMRLSAEARAKLWRDHHPRSMSYGPGSHPEEFSARAQETQAVRDEVARFLAANGRAGFADAKQGQ